MAIFSDELFYLGHLYYKGVYEHHQQSWECNITKTIRYHRDSYHLLKTPVRNLRKKEEMKRVQFGRQD